MANALIEMVRRMASLERTVERLNTRERPTDGGGGGGTVVPHPLPVAGGWHTGLLPWGDLNKTGSNLADLVTRQLSRPQQSSALY